MNNQLLSEIGEVIANSAFELFSEIGYEDDFSIQYIGTTSVVFGSRNRVIFTPKGGFKLDKSYCTEKFIHLWEEKY